MNTAKLNSTTVSDIVALNYHAAGVFREYGINFCCGGDITLQEACEQKGISAEEVTGQLMRTLTGEESRGDNYQEWSPGSLIDHIENTHHRFVRQKTREIAAYAQKVAHVHGQRHPWNVTIYQEFMDLSEELIDHLEEEEKTVFPLIRQIEDQHKQGQPIDREAARRLYSELERLHEDHEGAGHIMASISKASNGFTPPEDACNTYRILYRNLAGFEEDFHKHVQLEQILFRKAQAMV